MKKHILFVAVACLMAACHQPNDAPQLNNRTDTLSWAMGENIGYGYTSAQNAHEMWANSRDHRENILNPEYTCCGVGNPSGFYYEVLKPGKGANAQIGQRILFDYRSFLMFNGEPYDQTYGVRDPILHVVGRPMFQGLIDALQLMNAGSIYRFYFPYQLAFGETGAGDIPGYTPFIYEVELHEIYEH